MFFNDFTIAALMLNQADQYEEMLTTPHKDYDGVHNLDYDNAELVGYD
jgi:hypothetical protein